MTKLNLGSGRIKKEGYINVDIDPSVNPDMIYDLSKTPYPFEKESIELIEADHVLEHLSDTMGIMKEFYRILKPKKKLIIRVPHFSRGFTHSSHIKGFDISFPYYFKPDFKGEYSGIPFKLEALRLHWCSQPELKKATLNILLAYSLIIIGKIINLFANISPAFCSRVWCFWVGGFDEIEFHFTKEY